MSEIYENPTLSPDPVQESYEGAPQRAPSQAKSNEASELSLSLARAKKALLDHQQKDGHWCFELEADCTIPAEYILMMHFLDEIEPPLQKKLGHYILDKQQSDGGWPLYYGGHFDISCSVKCYYALKLAGHDPQAPYMLKAKEAILKHGGAAKCNVFTRITLAYFQQVPWRGVPFLPVETLLLPKWFPFHHYKVSYWSRTVMVPLLILCSLKAQAKNPTQTNIHELFITPPDQEKKYFPIRSQFNRVFIGLDRIGKKLEFTIPRFIRKRAIKKAEEWMIQRLNGEHGLGAIFPAKINAYKALILLGYDKNHTYVKDAKNALKKLIVERGDMAYCQPCFSPVWDTSLCCLVLQENIQSQAEKKAFEDACVWLKEKQITEHRGDWVFRRPHIESGGWPFQFQNDYYPDLDDTAVAALSLLKVKNPKAYTFSIGRAANWIVGMQSKNGGFASFEVDNTHEYLNEIPFADHGALLDPPTCDVSARCVMFLAHLGRPSDKKVIQQCIQYLIDTQEDNGSWFGRWGTNYIYGTWTVLSAFEALNMSPKTPFIQKAIRWLKDSQHLDGGWGEDNASYFDDDPQKKTQNLSTTSFQTALALLGLMAMGEHHSPHVKRGIDYLLKHQKEDGFWDEPWFTAPGFPRVFYLKYHGYSKYFPLWALNKYQKLTQG